MNFKSAFEFDLAKSLTNKDKHGIDFEEARGVFLDNSLVILDVQSFPEQRSLAIGRWSGKLWTVVFTMRRRVTRIISVRRSRTQEIKYYENQNANTHH